MDNNGPTNIFYQEGRVEDWEINDWETEPRSNTLPRGNIRELAKGIRREKEKNFECGVGKGISPSISRPPGAVVVNRGHIEPSGLGSKISVT